ncbi:MAG: YbjN domain-containing protein [SAR324 cluster bacterium]|nr:YbjN domain-containing protein [SAR324 cluster bacterium]MBL7035891.1 YbjN domain-containing protein [SAR324 cluster bacterium]
MITDFLHNCGDAEKEFVNSQEWWIASGSAKVQIFLTNLDDNAELVVASNLFKYPEQNPEINEYVLKLNGTLKLKGVSFGIRNKHLILSYVRPVKGLDPEELEWIIASMAVIADEYDDLLVEKFNL